MKRHIKSLILILMLILSSCFLFSCNNDDGEATDKVDNGKAVTLNVYNWGEYISDGFQGSLDVNKAFEEYYYEKFGVKVNVNYTTYATNEDMYSKLKSGAGTYDVVFPSDYMIQKMIEEDMLLEFDVTELENYQYVSEGLRAPYYDPAERYSVPYTYGMMGVIYNKQFVDPEDYEEESWGLLWNEKYKGKILQFNNQRDAFGSAMYYLGIDVNSSDPADWERALAKLSEQKSLLQAYVNDEIFNKMTTASAAIAPYFAGDFVTMSYQNEDLAFYYPKEGTNLFIDAMCILKNANQPEIAKEYINFMLSEEAAVANAVYIGYASPCTLVADNGVFNEAYVEGMGEDAVELLYMVSPEEINREYNEKFGTSCYRSFSPETQALVNSLWESLKTENSTELWVHITTVVIVGGVLALAIYNTYIKKKRSRDYRLRDKAKTANKKQ